MARVVFVCRMCACHVYKAHTHTHIEFICRTVKVFLGFVVVVFVCGNNELECAEQRRAAYNDLHDPYFFYCNTHFYTTYDIFLFNQYSSNFPKTCNYQHKITRAMTAPKLYAIYKYIYIYADVF